MKRLVIVLCALTIPVLAPVSPVEASNLPCPKWHKLMKQNGLPVREFSWIMGRESNCVARAVNWNYYRGKGPKDCRSGRYHNHRRCTAVRSWDVGLLQINSRTWNDLTKKLCGASTNSRVLMLPSCNLKVAGVIYKHYGFEPWKGNSNG
jgi:hypothetical protein